MADNTFFSRARHLLGHAMNHIATGILVSVALTAERVPAETLVLPLHSEVSVLLTCICTSVRAVGPDRARLWKVASGVGIIIVATEVRVGRSICQDELMDGILGMQDQAGAE